MDCRVCTLCTSGMADKFCICSNLPLLCSSCITTHEAKPGFHFALPIAGSEYVTPHNQSHYKMRLVCLATSHEKLRENLQQIDKCREEIEGMYAHLHMGLDMAKDQLLQTLEGVKGILSIKIEEAIRETSENAYLENYPHSTHLASLVWNHGSIQSSEPIPALTYQVTVDIDSLHDLLNVCFQSPIPEIASLSSRNKRMDLIQEIRNLPAELEEQRLKEIRERMEFSLFQQIIAPPQEIEKPPTLLESVEKKLKKTFRKIH